MASKSKKPHTLPLFDAEVARLTEIVEANDYGIDDEVRSIVAQRSGNTAVSEVVEPPRPRSAEILRAIEIAEARERRERERGITGIQINNSSEPTLFDEPSAEIEMSDDEYIKKLNEPEDPYSDLGGGRYTYYREGGFPALPVPTESLTSDQKNANEARVRAQHWHQYGRNYRQRGQTS